MSTLRILEEAVFKTNIGQKMQCPKWYVSGLRSVTLMAVSFHASESYCSEANNKTCYSQCCYFGNSFKMVHGWAMHALSLEALMNLSNSSTLTERQTSLIVQTASQSY